MLPISWIIHNYHLAHSSIHFDYCHRGRDSPLIDTHTQGGKKEKKKAATSCCDVDPAAPKWTPILERTQSLMGRSSSSAEGEYTGVWWTIGVSFVCWVGVEALKSKSGVCNVWQGPQTSARTHRKSLLLHLRVVLFRKKQNLYLTPKGIHFMIP